MALNLFKSLFFFLFFNISSSLSDHFEANGIQIHWVDYENETFFNLSTSNIEISKYISFALSKDELMVKFNSNAPIIELKS